MTRRATTTDLTAFWQAMVCAKLAVPASRVRVRYTPAGARGRSTLLFAVCRDGLDSATCTVEIAFTPLRPDWLTLLADVCESTWLVLHHATEAIRIQRDARTRRRRPHRFVMLRAPGGTKRGLYRNPTMRRAPRVPLRFATLTPRRPS